MKETPMRAPDPTLATPTLMADGDGGVFATHDDETHCSIVWPDGEDGPAIACVSTPTHFLGRHHLRHWTVVPLRDAAYVAVPCRECFPDAPEPGRRFVRDANGEDRSVTYEAGDLAWQTPDALTERP